MKMFNHVVFYVQLNKNKFCGQKTERRKRERKQKEENQGTDSHCKLLMFR
jgi:hypothetical protein